MYKYVEYLNKSKEEINKAVSAMAANRWRVVSHSCSMTDDDLIITIIFERL